MANTKNKTKTIKRYTILRWAAQHDERLNWSRFEVFVYERASSLNTIFARFTFEMPARKMRKTTKWLISLLVSSFFCSALARSLAICWWCDGYFDFHWFLVFDFVFLTIIHFSNCIVVFLFMLFTSSEAHKVCVSMLVHVCFLFIRSFTPRLFKKTVI